MYRNNGNLSSINLGLIALCAMFLVNIGTANAAPKDWISTDSQVVDLKKALKKLGHYNGSINASGGTSGLFTHIINFQMANGIQPATGFPTVSTYKEILAAAGMEIPDQSSEELAAEKKRIQTEAMKADVRKFEQVCKTTHSRNFLDCECATTAYAQRRKNDPEFQPSLAWIGEHPSCTKDKKEISEKVAQQCLGEIMMVSDMDNKSPAEQQAFCNCTGDTVAEKFLKAPKPANANTWVDARAACS